MPLSKIVRIDTEELAPKEREYFYKTSLDYTICQTSGRPLLSIDFDGIGGGFSRDGVYIQARETPDPYRKLKMDFKLVVTKAVNYTFLIVSYQEIESLDEEDSLTILDGIIGQALTKQEFRKLIKEMLEDERENIEEMQGSEQYDYIQDLVIQAEVIAELENDPIAIKAAKYNAACGNIGWSTEWLSDPPLPDIRDFFDVEGLKRRIEAMKHTVRQGCRIVVKTPKLVIVQPVWVRNFEGSGISPFTIAENIAQYLAFKRAYFLIKNES